MTQTTQDLQVSIGICGLSAIHALVWQWIMETKGSHPERDTMVVGVADIEALMAFCGNCRDHLERQATEERMRLRKIVELSTSRYWGLPQPDLAGELGAAVRPLPADIEETANTYKWFAGQVDLLVDVDRKHG